MKLGCYFGGRVRLNRDYLAVPIQGQSWEVFSDKRCGQIKHPLYLVFPLPLFAFKLLFSSPNLLASLNFVVLESLC